MELSSLRAWFDHKANLRKHTELERVRVAMLALIECQGVGAFPNLDRRIRYALTIEDLWFLRPDLLDVLREVHGESEAWRQMSTLNGLFRQSALQQGLMNPFMGSVTVRSTQRGQANACRLGPLN